MMFHCCLRFHLTSQTSRPSAVRLPSLQHRVLVGRLGGPLFASPKTATPLAFWSPEASFCCTNTVFLLSCRLEPSAEAACIKSANASSGLAVFEGRRERAEEVGRAAERPQEEAEAKQQHSRSQNRRMPRAFWPFLNAKAKQHPANVSTPPHIATKTAKTEAHVLFDPAANAVPRHK